MSRPCKLFVEGEGREHFETAVRLAMQLGDWQFNGPRPVIAYQFMIEGEYSYRPSVQAQPEALLCLVDYIGSTQAPYVHRLPFPMSREDAVAWLWAYATNFDQAGPAPDTDGSNKQGWQVQHPHSFGYYDAGALVAVRPYWITYGK